MKFWWDNDNILLILKLKIIRPLKTNDKSNFRFNRKQGEKWIMFLNSHQKKIKDY